MSYADPSPPAAIPDESLYQLDFYAWLLEQARLLREGRFDQIDTENLAEEILDVAKTEYRVLVSALRVLLLHILKWDHQPERRSRSWANTIAEQRLRVQEQLGESPSLKARIDEAVGAAYRRARLAASSETDLPVRRFPEVCPYDWEAILTRPFPWPENATAD